MKPKPIEGQLLDTVKLIKPHTHGGKDYPAGDSIDVTPAQKAWLAQRNIIDSTPSGD